MLLSIIACLNLKPVTLLDLKDEYEWVNTIAGKEYRLIFDEQKERIWYRGRMMINQDTFYISGFQKGNVYPSFFNIVKEDTTEMYGQGVFFKVIGYEMFDSIFIEDSGNEIEILPDSFYLKKIKKT